MALILALVGLLQLLLIFLLEKTTVVHTLAKRVFLENKQRYDDIRDLFGDAKDSEEADRTEAVLRVTDLISGLFSSAISLLVGILIGVAIGVIGNITRQRPQWMVISAYVAGGICGIFLVVLLVMILLRKVQDHAAWKRAPKTWIMRSVRNAVSFRTPSSYKLVVLITFGYLLVMSSQYADAAQLAH